MNPIPLPYMILGFILAFTIGGGVGCTLRGNHEQAIRDKAALAASQTEVSHANATTNILGTLLAVPELAGTDDVAARLCQQPADSGRVPEDASGPRPSRPAPARNPQADQNRKLAGELKQAVRLADEYSALVRVWHANEAK